MEFYNPEPGSKSTTTLTAVAKVRIFDPVYFRISKIHSVQDIVKCGVYLEIAILYIYAV